MPNLLISGNGSSVSVWCTNWTIRDISHEITILVEGKTTLDTLKSMMKPGAVKDLLNIYGMHYFVDMTISQNTIVLYPQGNLASYFPSMTAVVESLNIEPFTTFNPVTGVVSPTYYVRLSVYPSGSG